MSLKQARKTNPKGERHERTGSHRSDEEQQVRSRMERELRQGEEGLRGLPALLVQRDRPLGRRRADRRQFRQIRRHQDQRHPVTRERSLRSKGLPASNCEVEPFSISIKF